jgi:hypothetical protein
MHHFIRSSISISDSLKDVALLALPGFFLLRVSGARYRQGLAGGAPPLAGLLILLVVVEPEFSKAGVVPGDALEAQLLVLSQVVAVRLHFRSRMQRSWGVRGGGDCRRFFRNNV